jgi:hypothetical protein
VVAAAPGGKDLGGAIEALRASDGLASRLAAVA